jgi:hypothetical protein
VQSAAGILNLNLRYEGIRVDYENKAWNRYSFLSETWKVASRDLFSSTWKFTAPASRLHQSPPFYIELLHDIGKKLEIS